MVGVNQGGRVVKALDLRSNVRMHTWVRTPFLVWDPDTTFSFFLALTSFPYQHTFQTFSLFINASAIWVVPKGNRPRKILLTTITCF